MRRRATPATAATINQLRQAFHIQKLLERDARGGTRYTGGRPVRRGRPPRRRAEPGPALMLYLTRRSLYAIMVAPNSEVLCGRLSVMV